MAHGMGRSVSSTTLHMTPAASSTDPDPGTETTPPPKSPDSTDASPATAPTLSTADLDRLGFSRQGPDQTPLDAWWRLLNGATDYDTPESAAARTAVERANRKRKPRDRQVLVTGIAAGSDAWHDARTAGATLRRIHRPAPPPQQDLFSLPVEDVERYVVDEADLRDPKSFGGSPPHPEDIAEGFNFEEIMRAIAWDDDRIMVVCPRGACLVPRDRWVQGHRRCPAC